MSPIGQKKPCFKTFIAGKLKERRRKLKLNQGKFWWALGVTQSGGSRYESSRNIPKFVRALIRFVYNDKVKPNFKPLSPKKLKEVRQKIGLNQKDFWMAVGVTQSGGSRYENGRNLPRALRALIRIVYGIK